MGKGKKALRVVLDTNILVSALLFKGRLAGIVELWKAGRIVPVVSKETFQEFMAVLRYPKFELTDDEIQFIVNEEVLPYFEVVDVPQMITGACRDRDDDMFLSCAVAAGADFIVSGDQDLCSMRKFKTIKIIDAAALIKLLGKG